MLPALAPASERNASIAVLTSLLVAELAGHVFAVALQLCCALHRSDPCMGQPARSCTMDVQQCE